MHPKLRGCGLDILDDILDVILTYNDICFFKGSVVTDIDKIQLSPEVAVYWEDK
jgi:hypothetical protein